VVIAFYIFLSFLLPFLWIFYFYKKDKHPEPISYLTITFLLGIYAALISYYFEKNVASFLTDDWKRYLVFAFIEEFFKFFVVWFFIFSQKVFDETIDAMIYMMFSALGFAFSENFVLAIKPEILYPVVILIFRFFGANLLHILASSLIGFGYVMSILTRRIYPFCLSFLSGFFLHFLYNYIIIQSLIIRANDPDFFLFMTIPGILWLTFLVVLSELKYLTNNE
jgi:RsiW-degrading membrane proteinase PrsW (M82 family)